MSRRTRWIGRLFLICSAGILPGFVMRCDKAALNFQRGLFEGLGYDVASLVAGAVNPPEAG